MTGTMGGDRALRDERATACRLTGTAGTGTEPKTNREIET